MSTPNPSLYKKTKFGLIPNDWEEVKASKLIKKSTSKGYENLPLYSVTINSGLVDRKTLNRKFESKLENSDCLLVKKGELAYNMMRMWQGAIGLADEDCVVSPAYVVLKPEDDIDPLFLYYLFKTQRYLYFFESFSYGLTKDRLRLYYKDFSLIPLIYPKLPEQIRIAEIINTCGEIISKYRKILLKKQERKNAFSQFVFNERPKKSPDKWKKIELSELLNEHGKKSTGNESVFSVSVNKGLVNQEEHHGKSLSAEKTNNYNLVQFGDIVYTKSPTGKFPFGIIKQSLSEENVIVSPLYGIFSPYSFEIGAILNFYFDSPIRTKNFLNPIVQKGAKNTISISNKTFLKGKIFFPIDTEEINQLSHAITMIQNEIFLLNQIISTYEELKDALMQSLLTGKNRV